MKKEIIAMITFKKLSFFNFLKNISKALGVSVTDKLSVTVKPV